MNQESKDGFATQIDVVQNGYMVRRPYSLARDTGPTLDNTHVFESFEALVEFLRAKLPIYPVFSGMVVTATAPPKRKR